ncbi:NAD(P)/FAD-dependent oxidoreductase [Kribbella speibonae]|uniref:NAD(P)/FAD-dependent oxidoreductase n=1 Tax=Kribbella speibonae TaxID=1572660 RepID=UPI0013F3B8F5|nr:FAD-dependent oxidoreductase [Kribbella speibonae]
MRIVIIGAGVVGLACGYELLQDGHEVTVLDSSAAGQAASHGNAAKIAIAEAGPVPAPGMVVQGLKWMLRSDSPLYVKPSLSPPFLRFLLRMARNCTEKQFRTGLALNLRLASQSNEIFDQWHSAGLHFEMHQRGVLLAYEDTGHFEGRLRYQDVYGAYGAVPEVLDESGVHEVEPALSDRIRHGLFYSEDRQLEPDSLTAALVEHITKLGGLVHEDTRVVRFDRTARGVEGVHTSNGERLPCDGVVLAAGVWTAALAAQLGVALPIQPGKGYSVDYTPAPISLRTSLTFEDAHVAVTPLDGMIRVAGTMEFSGFDETVNPVRIAAIKRAAMQGFRDWDPDAPQREAWAGFRPMTPDGLPLVGPLTDGANVWVASGHAMLGLTLAPTTARSIRELVRRDAVPDPQTSPARFARRRRDA